MYFVQDAHSFWNWLYFVLLIVVSELEISEGKRAKLCEHKFLFCHILDSLPDCMLTAVAAMQH